VLAVSPSFWTEKGYHDDGTPLKKSDNNDSDSDNNNEQEFQPTVVPGNT
jgi:hypothetical protein